ncbi:hypothetical protein LRS73_17465 [Methylobacterium currus]|uniref:hypothetical protein n=1 Tax=Methylobacterium currus TaxID=2051553 RepID=UPI001E402020|nr:hypothetical protein [Methylobacterium currus]UHC14349.1 hypothetical protein LRS73_17465 [Methylobacterium currus]
MPMNWRLFPPITARDQTRIVNRRTYSGVPGTVVSVPEQDGQMLQANGWTYIAPSGPTSARPAGRTGLYAAHRGAQFFDESLGKLIVFDGQTWRDPLNGNAV